MLQLPASTANVTSLNTGTLDKDGDSAISSNTIIATDFSMNNAQLLAFAKSDVAFKSVKNLILNYDSVTEIYYMARPDFAWLGQYADLVNTFPTPTTYSYQGSYGFQLDTNSTDLTMDDICGTNGRAQARLEIFPPQDIVVTSPSATIYGPSNPMSSMNSGPTGTIACTNTSLRVTTGGLHFFAGQRTDGGISYAWGSNSLPDAPPPGYWQYKVNGVLKAQFDLGVSAPLTASLGIKGFVPVVKVNADAVTNLISSVDIKWYYWDGVTYVELTDLSVLQHTIQNAVVKFSTLSLVTEGHDFDPANVTHVSFTGTWYLAPNINADTRADGVLLSYSSAGMGYAFAYWAP